MFSIIFFLENIRNVDPATFQSPICIILCFLINHLFFLSNGDILEMIHVSLCFLCSIPITFLTIIGEKDQLYKGNLLN